MSIIDAARSGDRRQALEAMRDKLAAEMDLAESSVVAQISGQLVRVLAELDGMPAGKATTLDDLDKRRQDRLAAAKAPASPKRQAKQRGA